MDETKKHLLALLPFIERHVKEGNYLRAAALANGVSKDALKLINLSLEQKRAQAKEKSAETRKEALVDVLNPSMGCLNCGHAPFEYTMTREGYRCDHCGQITEANEDGIGREL